MIRIYSTLRYRQALRTLRPFLNSKYQIKLICIKTTLLLSDKIKLYLKTNRDGDRFFLAKYKTPSLHRY